MPPPASNKATPRANFFRGVPPPSGSASLTTITSPSGVRLSVNTQAAAAFQAFINALESRGYSLSQPGGSTGGYNRRKIAGTNSWSQHSWGNAVDLNQIGRGVVAGDYPEWIDDLAKEYGLISGSTFGDKGHFEWGGVSVDLPTQGGGTGGADEGSFEIEPYPITDLPTDRPPTDGGDPSVEIDPGFDPDGDNLPTDPSDESSFFNFDEPSESTTTINGGSGFGGMDFFGGRQGFNIPAWVNQYTQFPLGSPRGETPVGRGQVLIGNEYLQGDLSGPSSVGFPGAQQDQIDPETGQVIPAGPVLDPAALTDSMPTAVGPSAAPQGQPRIGVGTSTGHGDRLGSNSNPLFGVGAATGRRYFNTGSGWVPIGQAPSNIRWAPNSGTGNATASFTTQGYLAGGGDPGGPNSMTVGDEGRTVFDPRFSTGFMNDQGFIERRPAGQPLNSMPEIETGQ